MDYGNNKISNQKQLKEFNQLIQEHNQLAYDFYITISGMYEKKYDNMNDDITFDEMIDNIFDLHCEEYNVTEQEQQECVSEILYIFNQFRSESPKLKKTLEEHIENMYSTGYFRHCLDTIAYEANETIKAIEQENYDWAAEVIIYQINTTIVKLYPEMTQYYCN